MQKVVVVSMMLSLSIVGYAQEFKTIWGRVLEKGSNEPVPFCTVYILGESIGTIANERGEYQLNIPLQYWNDTLTVSHIGYQNFYGAIKKLSGQLNIELTEAIVDLDEVAVAAKRLTAPEIFERVIEKIKKNEGYETADFKMDGFFREAHASQGERTGVLECAIEIYDNRVTNNFRNIVIPQFRKVYERRRNEDQFIETKEGHNHLLLIMNGGINLVPLGKTYKSSVWRLPLEIEKITYYNDRLVYVLSNKIYGRELRLLVDVEDYAVYKNELILEVDEEDHERYAWQQVNTKGERCGAMIDHQGYEYRKVNGKLFPHYFFRRMDFRCYDLSKQQVATSAYLSKELLINNVEIGVPKVSGDRLKKKKGMINRKAPYDSAFWKYFNDIRDIEVGDRLSEESHKYVFADNQNRNPPKEDTVEQPLKIGDHFAQRFNRVDTLFGSLTSELSCYDVTHYDLSIEVDPAREWLSGTSRITFKMKEPADRIRIDLYELLLLDSVEYGGQALSFERDLDAVYIDFPHQLEKDSIYAIALVYEGHPLEPDFDVWASGFLWDNDSQGFPFSQSLCQGYGAKAWWPVKNHLSDEPDSADISITVPKELMAVSNGMLSTTRTKAENITYHWRVSYPINNYNIAAHIGNYTYHNDSLNDLPISYYYLKQDSVLAHEKLQIVPKMLEVYQKYFGPYPFPEDGFKIVQTPNAMEHQSCVAIGKHFSDQLILHESAHEWWGNNVSIKDNADIWIHEAFATYAESLYIEETLGYEIGQEYLKSTKTEIHNDYPLVGVYGVNHFHYRIEDKYFKGALMLNTLRHLVANDEVWFSTLKGLQTDFRHSFIDTKTIVSYFNEKLGKDYSAFFEQYLFTTQIPVLVWKQEGNVIKCRLENVVAGLEMELKIDEKHKLRMSTEWRVAEVSAGIDEKVIQSDYLIIVREEE